jgi:hypothetical protein
MSRKRLIHDSAWAAALAVLDSVRHLIREDGHKEAHGVFYEIIKAAIEGLDILQAREDMRLLRRASEN